MTDKTFLFDFDSTFIQVESLEILADIALSKHPEKAERLQAIHRITEQAMQGRYSYRESLIERMKLLDLAPHHLPEALLLLSQKITPSFLRNKTFFQQNAGNIHIITGGFIEIVWPIVSSFGIMREHIHANRLIYNSDGDILGFDSNQLLAQDQGKVKLVSKLPLKGDVIMIGDGYTDYEVKAAGLASTFVVLTENVTRDSVVEVADAVINELEGLFVTCNLPFAPLRERKKVLLLENIHPFVVEHFKLQGFEVESLKNALDPKELIHKLKDIHVLGIRSKTEISSKVIEACPHLEAIGAFCIGTNQIDLNTASQQGIAVFNAPFSNTRSVVELAIAEIILLARNAAALSSKLAKGQWHKSSSGAHEVRGKTLGIIGYGNIGSQLSIIAEALGMHVQFYDIADKLPLGNAKRCHHMEDLLSESDVVTVHVDGRKENRHLINEHSFSLMKQGVIFLNLSRDFTVDYKALYKAMASGKVFGCGIDVFENEPHNSPSTFKTDLTQFENIILTPHIGGSTEEAQQDIGEYVSKNLSNYVMAGSSTGSVNFPQLSLPSMHYPQRIIHVHKNVPGILAQINQLFAETGTNIEGQFLKTNQEFGYVITDINQVCDETLMKALAAIPHTIKVRVLDKLQ
ncbi:MAG: phosphoglycerate dehydrogenase [Candidatus Berkiella sp.]